MILEAWISTGSMNIVFQLAVPIQCGEPMASHDVKDSQATTPSGSSANSAK